MTSLNLASNITGNFRACYNVSSFITITMNVSSGSNTTATTTTATALERVQYPPSTPQHKSLWLLMVLLHVAGTRGAVGSILSMACSSVCSHGTCRYPTTLGNKATVTCHCHPGWGGEQCSSPCSRACGHGQCVFVKDQQVCLCQLGFIGQDCSQSGYDVVTLLSLARIIGTAPPLLSASTGILDGGELTTVSPAVEFIEKTAGSAQAESLPSSDLKPKQGDRNHGTGPALDGQLIAKLGTVDNPREHVQRNVDQGASQCMQNFVCRNGGRCVSGTFGGFRCHCKPPFFGTFCENSCPIQCQNGGRCLMIRQMQQDVSPSSVAFAVSGYKFVYRCVCPARFTGEQCQLKIGR